MVGELKIFSRYDYGSNSYLIFKFVSKTKVDGTRTRLLRVRRQIYSQVLDQKFCQFQGAVLVHVGICANVVLLQPNAHAHVQPHAPPLALQIGYDLIEFLIVARLVFGRGLAIMSAAISRDLSRGLDFLKACERSEL